jgi:chromate reductase, NAD(P)H dehydrogenase (quinone)
VIEPSRSFSVARPSSFLGGLLPSPFTVLEPIMRILVIPGTNRTGSLSWRLGSLVAADYEELGCEVDLLDLREMGPAFLDPGVYREKPPEVQSMVDRFLAADGVVVIVPEYNGSYPGILKLFIDMLPDPGGFTDRAVAFIGLAAGRFQSLRAVEHLQAVAGYRNAFVFPRRVFIGESFKQFSPDVETASLVDEGLRERLQVQAKGFHRFIEVLLASRGDS